MASDRTPEFYNTRRVGRVNQLVIHCSATPNGEPVSVATIDAWHRDPKKQFLARAMDFRRRQNPELSHIGYHFIVYVNGAMATGRHLDEMGQHVKGHNLHSIGICVIGTDAFTRAQWIMLRANIWAMQKRYPNALTCGHRDLSPDIDGDGTVEPHEWLKTCPGFNVADWVAGGMEPLAGHIFEPPNSPSPSPYPGKGEGVRSQEAA